MTKFWLLFLFPLSLSAQLNSKFINHLVYNKLNVEHRAYLGDLELKYGKSDSLEYFQAKFAMLESRTQDFFEFGVSSNNLVFSDTSLVTYAAVHFLKESRTLTNTWLRTVPSKYWSKNTTNIYRSILLTDSTDQDSEFLVPHLKYYFNDFKKFNNRKPVLAGLLSAVVPGLGKLYNGRARTFKSSFLVNAFFGAQAFEAIRVNGIKNAYSVISAGIFSVFYLSNIYGSYHDLKRVKIEKKKNFLDEVADYYSSSNYLYR